MAVRRLRLFGDPILRQTARPVEEVDERVRAILGDMADTLAACPDGAALAAPQVGVLRRLVVLDWEGRTVKLVNPRVTEARGRQACVEGCLSLPGRFGETVRPRRVRVEALDEEGRPVALEGEGDMAKCLCHELDHLDGVLFIDRLRASGRGARGGRGEKRRNG